MLRRLAALAALLTLTAFLLQATASAQTTPSSITLVKNTGQSDDSNINFSQDRGQSFRAGGSADGYKLTSVELDLNVTAPGGTQPAYTVQIYSEVGGHPNASLATLSTPSTLQTGLNTFSASGGGLDLAAGSWYFVVFSVSTDGTIGASWRATSSTAEDSGAAAGWVIAAGSSNTARGVTAWDPDGANKMQIKVNGYAKNYQAGNLGTAQTGVQSFENDVAHSFTTGSNTAGYTLSRLQLDINLSTPGASSHAAYSVSIHSDSSNAPGSSIGRLPRRTLSEGVNTFSAWGHGIDLAAGTRYWIVIDVSEAGTRGAHFRYTNNANVDTGSLAGWSTVDTTRIRTRGSSTWGSTSQAALRFAILGTPRAVSFLPLLVGNVLQGDRPAGSEFGIDRAQAFTTGSHASGYRLTKMQISFYQSAGTFKPNEAVTVKIQASGSNGKPDSTALDIELTKPSRLELGPNTFTASGNGIDLDPGTTYFAVVLFDRESSGNGYLRTTSDSEDSGGAAGWSIADTSYFNTHTESQWLRQSSSSLGFMLFGTAKGAPPSNTPSQPAQPRSDSGGPPPIPANMAYSPVQWNPNPHPMMQAFPTAMSEISSNRTTNGSGSLDLSAIAASVDPERQARSRGYYLSTRVYGLGEQPSLVERAPGGAGYITGAGEARHRVVRGSPLALVKLWHVYRRDTGVNGIERLGGPWYPRANALLAEPVELCLPAPDADASLAVRIRGDSAWTVLETVKRDGRLCADTVRVGWLVLVDDR